MVLKQLFENRSLARSAVFFAENEIPIHKFGPLADFLETVESLKVYTVHRSTNTAWAFVEFVDLCLLS